MTTTATATATTIVPPKTFVRSRRSFLTTGINTKSSPSLGLLYNKSSSIIRFNAVSRKRSLNVLIPATLPSDEAMAPFTPSRGDGADLEVGELVDVPGNMHGTVRFIGTVQGKKGTFAGVELSQEFAAKGKNGGDVEGVYYFKTTIPGAGIFLPINRALRRGSPLTPSTPSASGSRLGGQHLSYTPPTPSVPSFSQSVGPARAPSPEGKRIRPSLPRPESPIRRTKIGARPSYGTPAAKTPIRYGSPVPAKFGQSVRGTQDSRDPSKKPGFTPKHAHAVKSSIGSRSASALAGAPITYSDDDNTPVGIARIGTNGSLGSVSSFTAKIRPASTAHHEEETERLRAQLEERERQLRDQASTLAEMESSLNEVQTLMSHTDSSHNRGSMDDKDAAHIRSLLREKNEKIAMLTAEFDAHRADFRSTIDTLELASTETERVYEKRIEELIQENRDLRDRNEDVDSVARQLKQLEEFVQELEEGLEDARRGEAEARGEVEFLRGEVERTRTELRREREKAAAVLANGVPGASGDSASQAKDVEQRDDEIRGLKAIIHSLSRDAVPELASADLQKTPTQREQGHSRERRLSDGINSIEDRVAREKLEREVSDLRTVIETKSNREEELERELERLRRVSATQPSSQRASGMTVASIGTLTQDRSSKSTVVSWREKEPQRSSESGRRKNTLETMPESDNYSSANESFCELCETSGHDILTCTNMFPNNPATNGNPAPLFRTGKDVVEKGLKISPKASQDDAKPAPLSPVKNSAHPVGLVRIIPNPMESGPVAGKDSGVVNLDKWCGVCEREGHDSIDCPFEDAF